MIEQNTKEFIWCERYRPKKIDDCILPEETKALARQCVKDGQIQNMLFSGTAGVGKTTLAYAIAEEIGADLLYINASLENGIDVLRVKIQQFASTVSFGGGIKIVLLDEADHLNANSVQPALRAFMEDFSANCRFIFTCNNKNRIIEPLHSRLAEVSFKISTKEKPTIAAQFFKRITEILDENNVTYDKKVVAELTKKYFPDFRKTLNVLQRYSACGTIDSGILLNTGNDSLKELIGYMKEKNFTDVRKWAAKNSDTDVDSIFDGLYANAGEWFENASIPDLILILADYAHKAAFVANQELNLVACFVVIMMNLKFKE